MHRPVSNIMGLVFRDFAIILSGLGVVYNGVCAYFLGDVSEQLSTIPLELHLYTFFATSISALGLYGSIKNHAYSLSIFSNFLILDTLVCAIPRFFLLYLLHGFRPVFCDADASLPFAIPLFIEKAASSSLALLPPPNAPDHVDIVSDTKEEPRTYDQSCESVFNVAVAIMALGLVASTLVQMFFAVLVQQYAAHLAAGTKEGRDETKRTESEWREKELVVVITAPEEEMGKEWGSDEDIEYTYGDLEKGLY